MSDNVNQPGGDQSLPSELSQHGADLLTTPGNNDVSTRVEQQSGSIDAQFGSGDNVFAFNDYAPTSMWSGAANEAKVMAAMMGSKFGPVTEQIKGVGAALGHGAINT